LSSAARELPFEGQANSLPPEIAISQIRGS
jgi:hypothetical protein